MIQTYWINFADKGDPNGPDLPDWPNFTEDEQKVLYFNSISCRQTDSEPGETEGF